MNKIGKKINNNNIKDNAPAATIITKTTRTKEQGKPENSHFGSKSENVTNVKDNSNNNLNTPSPFGKGKENEEKKIDSDKGDENITRPGKRVKVDTVDNNPELKRDINPGNVVVSSADVSATASSTVTVVASNKKKPRKRNRNRKKKNKHNGISASVQSISQSTDITTTTTTTTTSTSTSTLTSVLGLNCVPPSTAVNVPITESKTAIASVPTISNDSLQTKPSTNTLKTINSVINNIDNIINTFSSSNQPEREDSNPDDSILKGVIVDSIDIRNKKLISSSDPSVTIASANNENSKNTNNHSNNKKKENDISTNTCDRSKVGIEYTGLDGGENEAYHNGNGNDTTMEAEDIFDKEEQKNDGVASALDLILTPKENENNHESNFDLLCDDTIFDEMGLRHDEEDPTSQPDKIKNNKTKVDKNTKFPALSGKSTTATVIPEKISENHDFFKDNTVCNDSFLSDVTISSTPEGNLDFDDRLFNYSNINNSSVMNKTIGSSNFGNILDADVDKVNKICKEKEDGTYFASVLPDKSEKSALVENDNCTCIQTNSGGVSNKNVPVTRAPDKDPIETIRDNSLNQIESMPTINLSGNDAAFKSMIDSDSESDTDNEEGSLLLHLDRLMMNKL
eukprot:Awhi_evm1s519